MPALQVRDLPEHVYRKLVDRATSDLRSITQETVVLLRKALDMKRKVARRLLIQRILKTPPLPQSHKVPDPATLLHGEHRE
jgi:plasmid stability protein